ncbi:right-handed parallel beta-helix repeat-containing protein [Serinibacter salmoneus]|uniref:Uncharacterized protein DUF1565 n=1 Tax=Serinibacter salmoneus TaxID=556530 RepID=A0A2A9D3N9_9MICO|nr:right-handed parallel beta-helix repeat-containing protein [Serinibacter salmoneus]PFG21273.1 uncharacterized protein DUF1565 [Serinibacter salmoneus]
MTEIHVATNGDDTAAGTEAAPLRTIGAAAERAVPGDTVLVHAGTYREWVKPRRGGLSDARRITYAAAPGEHVRITGAEVITGWEPDQGAAWRAVVPNALFGDHNPFAREVEGDWVVQRPGQGPRHLAEVYLDGAGSYEVETLEEVREPRERRTVLDDWTEREVPVPDVAATRRTWYAEVGQSETTIWASFDGADPREHEVEINVRRSVFYPTEHHLDYITVRGFELDKAACPWTPPTADQPGLIGPNWAKGWIIEDNDIHDAKCSAVSLGKEASTGHNYCTERGDKPGYQYQLESVFIAHSRGWDAEHIGSHIVRRNHIHDCGQNGVVGHLGCVFSVIEDNHIHAIATKREFYGYEIGGIKLHAAIDVQIRGNRIHDCSLGTWLDWQTQGTRVTRNLYYDNCRDLFIEVSHGPYVVDHNVLASPVALDNFSQGGAYVHNLVGGAVRLETVRDRATPYHLPHTTQVAGYAVIEGGDDRWIGNVFLGGDLAAAYPQGTLGHELSGYGTAGYAAYPATFEEYLQRVDTEGDHQRFLGQLQPAYLARNVYLTGAAGRDGEDSPVVLEGAAGIAVREEGDAVYLEARMPEGFDEARHAAAHAGELPRVRFADAEFEERDGSPVRLETDLLGEAAASGTPVAAGPIASLTAGSARIRVW